MPSRGASASIRRQIRGAHESEALIGIRSRESDRERGYRRGDALTGKQHQIFMYLLQHQGRVMTKEQIYESVWGESYIEGDKTLMVHIRYLREKLERDPANPEIIETVRGLGYRVRA